MLCGLTHVVVPVSDLEAATAFYTKGLGMARVEAEDGGSEWIDLEAAGVTVRLRVEATGWHVELRLQTQTVEEGLEALRALGGRLQAAACRQGRLLEGQIEDPDGNRLCLWRRLGEDELGEEIPLPVTREWRPEAYELLRSLLAHVPQEFRDLARRNCVLEAEWLAVDLDWVEREQAARAYIRATPRLLRDKLKPALRQHGFDPEAMDEDFRV